MLCTIFFFFFKQKTAYEMRISDWSSDVCSSDLLDRTFEFDHRLGHAFDAVFDQRVDDVAHRNRTIKLAGVRRLTDQDDLLAVDVLGTDFGFAVAFRVEIGRASCRERVCQYVSITVVAVSIKKKKTH